MVDQGAGHEVPSGSRVGRRRVLQGLGAIGMGAAAGREAPAAARVKAAMPWPKLTGSPVLDSLRPVIERARDVHTHVDKIDEVAGWMAYEELPMPDYQMPLGIGEGSAEDVIDFILTADCVDTAFTDFRTHVKFQVEYAGRSWSDSDALFACMKRALDNGIPVLDGKFLARVTRTELARIFAANIELPMLDEKMEVLHQVGQVLEARYAGRFRNFVKACSPRLYDGGNGLIERLVGEFPRFNDVSPTMVSRSSSTSCHSWASGSCTRPCGRRAPSASKTWTR